MATGHAIPACGVIVDLDTKSSIRDAWGRSRARTIGRSVKFPTSASSYAANRRARYSRTFTLWPSWSCLLCIFVLATCVHISSCADLRSISSSLKHLPKCKTMEMKQATNMANVVVSGTVKKLMEDEVHSTNGNRMYKGEVEIKRVFKGDKLVASMATVVPGLLRPHRMVMVEGFGDPGICDNKVRERDTKIFLLSPNGNGELKLNSSIVPLTLRNLDYVDAVVHDVPFITEKPKEVSPCYLYFCPFGATCHVNESTNQPMCVCEQRCSKVFAPVCGSDGATYTNLCMLDRASCIHNRNIKVDAQGPCGVRDPCEGHVCKFGAECMPSMDGKIARCQCPSDCPSYGDSVGSKPVCGNDGNDYANMCELRKAACYKLQDIRVKYYGKCDPCEGFTCEAPKVCQVNAQREPECHCNYVCSAEISLVCGTDGRTYSNRCLLAKQACKSRKEIAVLYNGKCSPENNPCHNMQCGPEEECSVDRNGRATCVCPPPCEPVLRRVCGNDSTTYDNECEMRRRACLEKVYVSVKHPGPCGTDSVCTGHYCDFGAVCVEHNGRAVCECPQCTEEYKPVCGENGITYENECKLRQENCQREENIKVSKQGSCADECGQQKCEFYAVCETLNGRPRCICPTSCVKVDAPVCGNDGVTYANECELRVESCRRKKFLTIASTGTCDKCKGVTCEFNAKCENGVCVCPILCPTVFEPVCGSDDRTYVNECEMRKYSCAQSIFIEVTYVGECEGDQISGSGGSGDDDDIVDGEDTMTPSTKGEDCTPDNCIKYGGTCELDGLRIKCVCKFGCEAVRQPVCGSDGRTYGNTCIMLHQSCLKKQVITDQPMENCDEFDEQEPCDGSTPLINPDKAKDYDCSPGQDMCPPNSYCHITLNFSKCCKRETAPITRCSETQNGCCKDGKTPANGPRGGGCPEVCHCNPMGSYSSTCDPRTRQCTCKPGVGGKRCDRCDIGYWGLHKIGTDGNAGCIPCNCNKFGSHRDDCDQMTGRCMCKPLIMGMKCDMCRNGNVLGADGCRDQIMPSTCSDLNCQYGATCREDGGHPVCVCEHACDANSQPSEIVCGTDGQNYGSQCQLELFGCRLQKEIAVAYFGACKGAPPTAVTTISPVTKSRKTTRHIDGSDEGHTDDGATSDNRGTESVKEEAQKCAGSNIDDLCLDDKDCCPNHSRCRNGLCYCFEGYIPSLDNTQCYEVETKPTEKEDNTTNACSANPCQTGQCMLDELLGFRCACPLGKSGPLCNRNMEFSTPSFSGRSHLELPRIDKASQDLSIEVVFSTLNKDGIILFNAKHRNGEGDFVSLTVNDGFVEFRYDLGGGPAILKSRDPVEPIRSHRVIARRLKESGILIVDNEEAITGSSPSTHTSLDLNDPLLLGFIPKGTKETFEKVGVDLGLVGCIHSVRAGSRDDMYSYNLALYDVYSDVLEGVDITECGNNPCKSMPCRNGATCLVLDAQIFECRCKDGYKGILCEDLVDPCASGPCQYGGSCVPLTSQEGFFCQCPQGREGMRCERESMPEVFVPQFTGDSYMEMPLEEKLSTSLSITVWFKAMKPDGMLLFVTQSPRGQGDFIALNLEENKLVFTFFLGSGVGKIESKKHIHLDKWHAVTVTRKGREGEMTIDGHPPVTGEASSVDLGGTASMLNIDNRPLFLGGFREKEDLPKGAGITSGFTGAIQRIIINGRTIDGLMSSALTMRNISTYNGPPCNVNPCMNGGVCVPMLNLAECRCPASFMGERCEKRYEQVDRDQPVRFDGMTYLSYPNEVTRKQEGQQSNQFVIKFRTTESDGILLLQAGGDTVTSDYLSLAVSNGHLELSYNLGKQGPGKLHIIRSTVSVTDGVWHTAKVIRQLREGSLQVDNEDPVIGSSDAGTQQLDTDGLLWVGGRHSLPWGLPTMKNFKGCIEDVQVNGQQLHLVDDKNGHSTTIKFCT